MGGDRDARKRRAARRAAGEASDGDVLGLGSGSTAAEAIRAIGERVDDGLDVVGVPTSYQAADLARSVGIPVRQPADVAGIDLAIDGADQVAGMDLIKGGGAAHAREKVVDAAAERFFVVVDDAKLADELDAPVPIEVLPDARPLVADRLRAIGGEPVDRIAVEKSGPVVTDNGNLVLDCSFGSISDPATLAAEIAAIPGIIDHGLFVGLADAIFIGSADGVTVRES